MFKVYLQIYNYINQKKNCKLKNQHKDENPREIIIPIKIYFRVDMSRKCIKDHFTNI